MTYTLTPAQSLYYARMHWFLDQKAKAWLNEPGRIPEGRNPPMVGGTPFDMAHLMFAGDGQPFVQETDDGYHISYGEARYWAENQNPNPPAWPSTTVLAPYLMRYTGASFWQGGTSLSAIPYHADPDGTPWVITAQPPAPPVPPPAPGPTPPPPPVPPVVALCPPGALCLGPAGRFQVTVSFVTPISAGVGVPIPLTADTGAVWFFDAQHYELMVRITDGVPLNGKWWVFYGSLTNVAFTLTVKDSKTGVVREYINEQGRMASVGDTEAFLP